MTVKRQTYSMKFVTVGMFLFLQNVLCDRSERQTTECPIDFVKHEDSCYHIFDVPTLKWWEAMAFCNMYADGKGSLAVIDNESEELFLEGELRTRFPNVVGKDFWLGANDIVTEGTWVWIKKNEYVREYTHWAPNEPSSGTAENCLALYDGLNYLWNDAPCDLPEGFICEVPAVENVGVVVG